LSIFFKKVISEYFKWPGKNSWW